MWAFAVDRDREIKAKPLVMTLHERDHVGDFEVLSHLNDRLKLLQKGRSAPKSAHYNGLLTQPDRPTLPPQTPPPHIVIFSLLCLCLKNHLLGLPLLANHSCLLINQRLGLLLKPQPRPPSSGCAARQQMRSVDGSRTEKASHI